MELDAEKVWAEAVALVKDYQGKGVTAPDLMLLLGTAIVALGKMIEGEMDFRHAEIEEIIQAAVQAKRRMSQRVN